MGAIALAILHLDDGIWSPSLTKKGQLLVRATKENVPNPIKYDSFHAPFFFKRGGSLLPELHGFYQDYEATSNPSISTFFLHSSFHERDYKSDHRTFFLNTVCLNGNEIRDETEQGRGCKKQRLQQPVWYIKKCLTYTTPTSIVRTVFGQNVIITIRMLQNRTN